MTTRGGAWFCVPRYIGVALLPTATRDIRVVLFPTVMRGKQAIIRQVSVPPLPQLLPLLPVLQ